MLIFKIALRELRGGLQDFRLFLGCLIVGVTVIASVGVLAGRVESGIRSEAGTLLGGDVEISLVNAPATPEELAFLRSQGRLSLTLGIRAMATFGADSTLVELKGVDAAYPLLGKLELVSGKQFNEATGNGRIAIGQDLQDRLGVKPGDRLKLADAEFVVSGIIAREPDRIAGAFSLGPRVMASAQDVEKTGLLAPGGFAHYNYRLVLAAPSALEAFRQELARRFPHAGWIVKTVNESNRTVKGLVERLQLFLTLAGLSSLLIGGVGIMNATESYIAAKSVTIATFKSLGARRGTVFAIYMAALGVMTLLGIFLSFLASMLLSASLIPYLAHFFPVSLKGQGDMKPMLLAAAFGALTVLAFSFAAIARGVGVKPTLLFRGGEQVADAALTRGARAVNVLLALLLIALVLLTSSDEKIAAGFIGAALVCFGVFTLVARATAYAARHLSLNPGVLRLAVGALWRPGAPLFSIMLSIGIGMSVLVALLLVEGNIERDIHESIPAQAPSLFLIDIQPSEQEALMKLLASKPYVSGVKSEPMVRGRIAKLNGVPVEQAPISDDAKWATESDRGLSFAALPPEGTRITEGQWWQQDYRGKTLVSLDRKLAQGMGLKPGGTITLNILGEDIDATIASLREVNYMSMRINFALILSPGAIERFPFTTIATLRVDSRQNESALVRDVTRQFPNISSVRLGDSLAQLAEIVGNISTAVRITALFVLVAGGMVLASALATSLDKRAYDTAMFKVLGAKRRDILAMFLTEWIIIAAITGVLSCAFGMAGAWLILQRLGWIEFHFLAMPVMSAMAGVIGFIVLTGLLLHSRAFSLKANVILRNE